MSIAKGSFGSFDRAAKNVESSGKDIQTYLEAAWKLFEDSHKIWQGQDHMEFIRNGANKHYVKLNGAIEYFGITLPSQIEDIRNAYAKSVKDPVKHAVGNAGVKKQALKELKAKNESDNFDNDSDQLKSLQYNAKMNFDNVKECLKDIESYVKNLKWEGDAQAAVVPWMKKQISSIKQEMDNVAYFLNKNVIEAIARKEQADKDIRDIKNKKP